jgi:SSS family solute:Na+ symporter
MYGAGITPALLAALAWPRVTRQAGLLSIAAGLSTSLGWEVLSYVRGGDFPGVQTIYPALVLSAGTLLVVTMLSTEADS